MAEKRQGLTLDRMAELVPSGVINLKGKRAPTTRGLIAIMHQFGVESIETETLEHDPEKRRAVVRAVVTGSRGTYSAHGDASPDSVSKMILPHYLRMAETRAIGRALRFALGVGEAVSDELTELPEDPGPVSPPAGREKQIGETGYTVDEVEGYLAWKKKPPFSKLAATDRRALLDWLETENGARAIHAYHIRDLEGS
tara:strand:- start:165 stop:758 length:594 start_codon:yes stop_codon:yes gene_type:complete